MQNKIDILRSFLRKFIIGSITMILSETLFLVLKQKPKQCDR
jgi:hypothetical protein